MIVVCGLGNPGKKYTDTRHNLGFKIIDKIRLKYKFNIYKKDQSKEVYKGKIKRKEFYLLKPLTYMNLSGLPLSKFLQYYKIPIKNLTVVHDDLDLKLGKIKIKKGGGNAGHNGLQNIDDIIGNSYNRLRIGIGHPLSNKSVNKYVLEKFNAEEKKIINKIIDLSVEHIDLLFSKKELFLTKISLLFRKNL